MLFYCTNKPPVLSTTASPSTWGGLREVPAIRHVGISTVRCRAVPSQQDLENLVQGKRFTCIEGCGKCCQGSGEVWVNDFEQRAISNLLNLGLEQFRERYTKRYRKRPGWRLLRNQSETLDCIFLEQGTKCSIYGTRPLQCMTFPFWPDIVESEDAWQLERRTLCEGIEHSDAPVVDTKDAASMLLQSSVMWEALEEAKHKRDREQEKV